jgi:hypothetical protein
LELKAGPPTLGTKKFEITGRVFSLKEKENKSLKFASYLLLAC